MWEFIWFCVFDYVLEVGKRGRFVAPTVVCGVSWETVLICLTSELIIESFCIFVLATPKRP